MRFLGTLEQLLRSLDQVRAGRFQLQPNDVVTLKDALRAWFTFLLDSAPYTGEDEVVRKRRLLAFAFHIVGQCRRDVNVVFRSLRALIAILLGDAKRSKKTSLRSFKGRAVAGGYRPYVEGLLSAESLVGNAYWMADWKYLYSSLRFLTKLPLEASWLKADMLKKFTDNLERVRDFDLGEASQDIDDLNAILKGWLSGFHIKTLRPKHGPGAVAEGRQAKQWLGKWGCMASDSRVSSLARYLQLTYGSDWVDTMETLCLRDLVPSMGHDRRIAKLVFVPKTSLDLRTILSEPALMQYLQQGVLRELVGYIDSHKHLHRCIDFSHQEYNQVLARIGSRQIGRKSCRHGNWNVNMATIDLSMASDSISWALTRRLFRGCELLLWMHACRSTHMRLPDKQVIESPIFAPMGSALCFPTQSLIFASIVELCRRRFRAKFGIDGHDLCPTYRVYGDDIVVPAVLAGSVKALLLRLGFLPNENKCFEDGPFRESCGKEYYDGVDVTPLYYRIKSTVGDVISATSFASVCSAANNAADWGHPALRKYYLRFLMSKKVSIGKVEIPAIPYFTDRVDRDPDVWSPNPTNWRLPTRWSKRYQCRQTQRLVVKVHQPVKRTGPLWDSISYRQWLIERTQTSSDSAEGALRPRVDLEREKLTAALHNLVYPGSGNASLVCFVDLSPKKDPYGKVDMVYALKWTHLLG